MSVKRYEAMGSIGYPSDDYIIEDSKNGRYVLYTDHAALEARCAGLERERDALLAQDERREMYLIATLNVAERAEAKADALQAKLAAAVEALRLVRTKAIPAGGALVLQHGDWKSRVTEVLDIIDAILAGHSPATPQQAAPSDRETLIEALKVAESALADMCDNGGGGLEVYGWHLNGDTEPLDTFIDDAGVPDALTTVRAALADTTTGEVNP